MFSMNMNIAKSNCLNISKKKIYNNLIKKEIHPSVLNDLGFKIPSNTAKVLNISAKKRNGISIEFYLLKNKSGKNLGSRTIYSNGLMRSIDIRHDAVQTDWKNELPILEFDTTNAIYHNLVKLNGKILKETTSFSEIFKKNNYQQKTNQEKSNKINNFYQCIVRIKENFNKKSHKDISQEVLQIEGDKKTTRKFFKFNSHMKPNGEINIKSYICSKNVKLKTENPYFKIGLLSSKNMLRVRYREIAKENRLDGIEPPLVFENNKKAFNNNSKNFIGGVVPNDNSYIGINTLIANDKINLVKVLGHECEHLFKQNTNIHLSGLKNMMSEDVASKRFYKGAEKRLSTINENSQKYKDAELCLYEKMNYQSLVCSNGKLDANKHNSLYKEQSANLAGDIEVETFQEYIKDLKQNFSLFNTNFALKNDK